MDDGATTLRKLLSKQCGVVARRQIPASEWERVRWQLESGRWQRVVRGLFVHHCAAITIDQRRWIGVLGGGEGAALCAATAAEAAGLTGFEAPVVHVCIPANRKGKKISGVRYHPRRGGVEHLTPNREPPRVVLAHALIAMASSAHTPARAHHILTAAVQQRLVRPASLQDALATKQRLPNRQVIAETLTDIDDGAQSLNEVALLRLVDRIGVPRPQLQIVAATNRRRSRLDGGWPAYAACVRD